MPNSSIANPPLNARFSDLNGNMTPIWSMWFEQSWKALLNQISGLETTIAGLQTEVKRNAISSSSTVPTALLTQLDTGTAARVTMAAHKRLYDGGSTADVDSAFVDVPYGSDAAFYYDDEALDGGVVSLQYTLSRAEAQANYATGRHFLGTLTTLVHGDPPVVVPEGGSFPPGGGGGFHYREIDLL